MEKTCTLKITKEISCDVLVVGGGVGGCSAAAAAARCGADVILVESSGILGGQATLGLVTPLDARYARNGVSFGGIMTEVVARTFELTHKYSTGGQNQCPPINPVASPHILKYALLETVTDSGAKIMLHTTLISAECDGDRISSVILSTKSGLVRVFAKNFIDATGDADLAALSGAKTVKGSEVGVYDELFSTGLGHSHGSDEDYKADPHSGLMQPTSIFFIMGGVDYERAAALNNVEIKFGDLGITREKFREWKYAGTYGFEENGEKVPMPQGRVLVSGSTRTDVAVINMSRVIGIDGSDADSLNDGEIKAQKQLIAIVDFLKTFIPGFESSYLIQSGFTLGIRETRRIKGRYTLSGTEAINCARFDDAVARGSYIIDIHDPSGKARAIGGSIKGDFYEIPYGSILSRNRSNLLACGRCISVDHIAHSSTRIQGTCMLTGQAAGTAAALSAVADITPDKLSPATLREKLVSDGVYLN